jgi:flavin reductase (DIM6/NTAB) family NADH-FMN oxidoreductase RutF
MPVSPTEFRTALRCFAAGVTIVTTRDPDGRPTGLTASAFTSVSLAPPLVLVCVDHGATAHPSVRSHGWFAVNVLRREQESLSRRFAETGGDKFAGVAYHEGRGRLPILEDVLVALECRVVDTHEAGDHTIFIGRVEGVTMGEGVPLLYFDGGYHALGGNAHATTTPTRAQGGSP